MAEQNPYPLPFPGGQCSGVIYAVVLRGIARDGSGSVRYNNGGGSAGNWSQTTPPPPSQGARLVGPLGAFNSRYLGPSEFYATGYYFGDQGTNLNSGRQDWSWPGVYPDTVQVYKYVGGGIVNYINID